MSCDALYWAFMCRRVNAGGHDFEKHGTYNDALEGLVHDRRKNTVVVVGAKAPEDRRKFIDVGLVQNSQADVDRLHVTRSRRG